MNRDMDLARDLLLQIAGDVLREDEWGKREIYHLKMLNDVEFIQGISFLGTWDGLEYGLGDIQLTWHGHEFLDTIREKTVWEKIKKVLKDKSLGATVETIKLVAPSVLASILK